MSIVWIEDPRDLATAAATWPAPAAGHPFCDHEWFSAWWQAFGRGRLRVAVWDGPGGRGALSMERRRGVLASTANYHSPIFEPAGPRGGDLLREAMGGGEPEVFLHAVPAERVDEIRSAAAGRRLLLRDAHTSPIVCTSGALEDYLAGLGSTLKRRRRKVDREHEVELRLSGGDRDLEAELQAGFEIEASGWKARTGTAILSSTRTREFYLLLAEAYRARGELVLGTLVVDGRAVAWHFSIRRGPRLFMLKTGYLQDAKNLAPGLLLHLGTIEHCFTDPGTAAYELLGDAERWKLEFAQSERRHVQVRAFRRTPVGSGRYLVRQHALTPARRALDAVRSRRSKGLATQP